MYPAHSPLNSCREKVRVVPDHSPGKTADSLGGTLQPHQSALSGNWAAERLAHSEGHWPGPAVSPKHNAECQLCPSLPWLPEVHTC